MSNFYCTNCPTVLNSKSDYGIIKGKPYCKKCLKIISKNQKDIDDDNCICPNCGIPTTYPGGCNCEPYRK